jgi:hypothetical protein
MISGSLERGYRLFEWADVTIANQKFSMDHTLEFLETLTVAIQNIQGDSLS